MKKLAIALMFVAFLSAGCANTGYYNTQKGAAVGAGIGAVAGQAIGRNTEATLLGAGVGGIFGLLIGNGMDQQASIERERGY